MLPRKKKRQQSVNLNPSERTCLPAQGELFLCIMTGAFTLSLVRVLPSLCIFVKRGFTQRFTLQLPSIKHRRHRHLVHLFRDPVTLRVVSVTVPAACMSIDCKMWGHVGKKQRKPEMKTQHEYSQWVSALLPCLTLNVNYQIWFEDVFLTPLSK